MFPRLHLFELLDQPWLPAVLRRGLTDSLRSAEALIGLFEATIPLIAELAARSGRRTIVDLGSGSGGPLLRLFPTLRATGAVDELVLTDLFPLAESESEPLPDGVTWAEVPVDAAAVPRDLRGLRLMCNSFHHLTPDQARAVLSDAERAGEPLLVLEALGRDPISLLAVLGVGVMGWVVVPFHTRMAPARALLWWALPVAPVLVMWEGFVSCLRAYSRRELDPMVDALGPSHVASGVVRTWFPAVGIRWFYFEPVAAEAALPVPASSRVPVPVAG